MLNPALVHNINKVAKKITDLDEKEKWAALNEDEYKSLYKSFAFQQKSKTIFEHELDIIQPNTIIFAVGVKYMPNIETYKPMFI